MKDDLKDDLLAYLKVDIANDREDFHFAYRFMKLIEFFLDE
jgi:hypothetical protein